MENKNGIIVETKEDRRLEVVLELSKTVSNLSEILKDMETPISSVHINGLNVKTGNNSTAISIGSNVKDSSIMNSKFDSIYEEPEIPFNVLAEDINEKYPYEDDYENEEVEDYEQLKLNLDESVENKSEETIDEMIQKLINRLEEL